jgi:hypothetical protein
VPFGSATACSTAPTVSCGWNAAAWSRVARAHRKADPPVAPSPRPHAGPEEHIESSHPGYLLCQDTYFVDTLKGAGEIYMQSVVDAFCSHAWGKLYLSKTPITAAGLLNDRVLPFYDEHGLAVQHALTDNGREYCGRELHHAYELYLAINQIGHRRTGVCCPETNGFCERFHRTVKEEFFSVAFRQKLYGSVAELQADLDRWLELYNTQRPHQGYRTKGRTPHQAFLDGPDRMRQATAAKLATETPHQTSAWVSGDLPPNTSYGLEASGGDGEAVAFTDFESPDGRALAFRLNDDQAPCRL